MPCFFDLIECEKQFERIMWVLATEISRAFKGPRRIDERKLHDAASGICASAAGVLVRIGASIGRLRCSFHQFQIMCRFWRTLIFGFQPVWFVSFSKSVT